MPWDLQQSSVPGVNSWKKKTSEGIFVSWKEALDRHAREKIVPLAWANCHLRARCGQKKGKCFKGVGLSHGWVPSSFPNHFQSWIWLDLMSLGPNLGHSQIKHELHIIFSWWTQHSKPSFLMLKPHANVLNPRLPRLSAWASDVGLYPARLCVYLIFVHILYYIMLYYLIWYYIITKKRTTMYLSSQIWIQKPLSNHIQHLIFNSSVWNCLNTCSEP